MTNPTSNFGWQMPTPTDLVTDLPADFEVFGQAVDTSMADLKGGTTGQILSKATNTDMDFTWITNDVGDITAVTVTAPITGGGTSGSVGIAISAATTSASGAVQLSDSTSTTSSVLASTPTATKAAYDLAASAYAPAFTNNFYAGKNKIINGDFRFNQRAFTSTTTNATYGFDRFRLTTADGTTTYSAQTFTLGAAPVAGYEATNFARIVSTGQTLTTARSVLSQFIESVKTFAGQTVTISFWAKASTGTPSVAVNAQQYFGSGGSPSANVETPAGKTAITTSWARYQFSVAVPSISGKTIGTNNDDNLNIQFYTSAGSTFNTQSSSLGIQSVTIDFWGVQVEAGSTATPFQTASGSLAGELALCQRYYIRYAADNVFAIGGLGFGINATSATVIISLPVEMRANPTSIDYSTLSVSDGTTTTAVTVATLDNATKKVEKVNLTVASGLTANRPYFLFANNSSNFYFAFIAEL
jgi:hypothetical protein